jgi:ribosomal protein S18 acetylase RimI-like enzyme
LLEEVERRAREGGCCRLTLEVFESNTSARRIYRNAGYRGDGAESEATYFLKKPL